MIIYKTTNLLTGKIYVGQDRKNNPRYFGSGLYLKRALKKYGFASFKKEILEFCEATTIDARETYWIEHLSARDPNIGYNIAKGGLGKNGVPCSEETRIKISNSEKGKVIPKELRQRWSEQRMGIPMKPGIKKKISATNTGKIFSLEHRKKLALINLGRVRSAASRLKQSHTLKLLGHSEKQVEQIRQLGLRSKGKVLSKETREKISQARWLFLSLPKRICIAA